MSWVLTSHIGCNPVQTEHQIACVPRHGVLPPRASGALFQFINAICLAGGWGPPASPTAELTEHDAAVTALDVDSDEGNMVISGDQGGEVRAHLHTGITCLHMLMKRSQQPADATTQSKRFGGP